MSSRVTVTEHEKVATVTLSRPDKRNALDTEMLNALVDAGTALCSRSDIRAVILTGDGPAFCSGIDIGAFPRLLADVNNAGGLTARTHEECNLFQAAAIVWQKLPQPVIAALHGYVFGGGFQVALGADIRIAAPDTEFSVMEGKWGIVPDMGGMVLMRQLARTDIIRRLTWTAEIFNAKTALNWGFITEVSANPLDRATDLAREISMRSPDAVRAAKKLIRDTAILSTPETLLEESETQNTLLGSKNQIEAMMAGMEKRPPDFTDPE